MAKRLRQIYLHFKNTDSRDSLLLEIIALPFFIGSFFFTLWILQLLMYRSF